MLAFSLGSADSRAQFGGGNGSSRSGGLGGMMGGSRGGNRDQGNQDSRIGRPVQPDNESFDQIEYRLTLLEDELHLQKEQVTSWQSFAAKVTAYAGDLARARAHATNTTSTSDGSNGVQYIEQTADAARNRATALDDVAIAAKALYAGLTADQKKLADLRIVTIFAPQSRAVPTQAGGSNLPDLGSSGRTQR